MTDPIGRRTSEELTEARTVLSRAESGMERLDYLRRTGRVLDPDHYAIARDLMLVQATMDKYRRTGRPTKRK